MQNSDKCIDDIISIFNTEEFDLNDVASMVYKNRLHNEISQLLTDDNYRAYVLYILDELPKMETFPLKEVIDIRNLAGLTNVEVELIERIIANSKFF
jgi:hypothetical protein